MTKPLIDPKELFPAVIGFALGLALIGFFAVLAKTLDLQLYVDYSNIPRQ
jgi:hypothetical protein